MSQRGDWHSGNTYSRSAPAAGKPIRYDNSTLQETPNLEFRRELMWSGYDSRSLMEYSYEADLTQSWEVAYEARQAVHPLHALLQSADILTGLNLFLGLRGRLLGCCRVFRVPSKALCSSYRRGGLVKTGSIPSPNKIRFSGD